MGGVIGLSLTGEPLLPESSVKAAPEKTASEQGVVKVEDCVQGAELVGLILVEKRLLVRAVVSAEGADLRFGKEGGENGRRSSGVCGGGLLREGW